MEMALAYCRKHLGDKATILYTHLPSSMQKMVREQGKETGGAWDCYYAYNFYGWEADRVVAVTNGGNLMELITRAKTHLCVILVEGDQWDVAHHYAKTKADFQQATEQGLAEMVQLSADSAVCTAETGEIKQLTN